jgi:peptidoglycan hydrolase-like protein with peptidoglycan-binding domain
MAYDGHMTLKVPYGYAGKTETLEQTRAKHQAKYHPEAWRRIEAVIVASEGLLGLDDQECLCGIGGGARTREEQAASYARDPNTFAPPDSSFHQIWDKWADGQKGAQAIDWVGARGRHQEAWKWLRDNGGLYGLKTFWNVNGEPWHSQMVDVPNSVSQWKANGYTAPGVWTFPGVPIPAPSPPGEPFNYGLWPFNKSKPAIQEGSIGDAVRYFQQVCNDKASKTLLVDGQFGPATKSAAMDLQAYFGIPPVDGVVDKPDWDLVDALAGYVEPPPPPPPANDPQIVLTGLYYVQRGDGPWPVEKKVYGGTGANWAQHFTVEQFSKPDVQIPLPDLPGVATKVQPGEGPYQVIKRMYPTQNQYATGRLERFYALNGGPARVLHAGDVVFLDTPK